MDSKKYLNHGVLLWGIFYLIAHGGILLIPNAIFWDDWLLYRMEPSVILETFRQAGSMFNQGGYQHVVMLAVGPWLYKILTFILMFASGLLLNSILKRHVSVSAETRFFIVLLFLVLPFNTTRVTLITFPGTLRYFFFFAAWFLMDRYRIVALILFFVSFSTNSLLMFYTLPILDMFYRSGNLSSLKSAQMFSKHRIDFILLPFIFFFIKIYFFSPSAAYVGYNENYSLNNLISAPQDQAREIFSMMKAQLNDLLALHVGAVVRLGLCISLSVFAFLLLKNKTLIANKGDKISWRMLALGLFATLLASFPYWLLGLAPTYYEWRSRHQLLLPLGAALTVAGMLYLLHRGSRMGIMSIIVGASLTFNLSTYADVFVDWQKQSQLIQLFSKNSNIEHAGLIIIHDNTADQLNAFNRVYRFYEWNGMMGKAFGNEKHFCVDYVDLDRYLSGEFDQKFSSQYKAGLFRKDSGLPSVIVDINLTEAKDFYGRLKNSIFPELTISVKEIKLP